MAALILGVGLIADGAARSSATYDEVAYQRIAARWYRSGDQDEITRMGSPLTFWKLQQTHTLEMFDRLGQGRWIDDPERFQAESLPWLRIGASWTWIVGFALTVAWAARMHGPGAAVAAAWLFTLSPNLLAHGGLITMEAPLVACAAGIFWMFWEFLRAPGRGRAWWLGSAVLTGVAFSCKFTTILIGPMLTLAWCAVESLGPRRELPRRLARVLGAMIIFGLVAIVANLAVTGFALLPISPRVGDHPVLVDRFGKNLGPTLARLVETPIPQDWVGFLTQMSHQRHGGPSSLFGEVRNHGWWYYYFVALAVKAPLSLALLALGRVVLKSEPNHADATRSLTWLPIFWIGLFFLAVAAGSSRNYGVRYLLPTAPLAIVWISGLARAGRVGPWILALGLLGQGLAVLKVHPHELSYFNELAGGARGGRKILADSNLDWGQGARDLARLQRRYPDLSDLTTFYFGDTHPAHYGVQGEVVVVNAVMSGDLEPPLEQRVKTRFVAVSASLQYGPWSKPLGYFASLNSKEPWAILDDSTIAIYEMHSTSQSDHDPR